MDLILGKDNSAAQWADQNTNWLGSVGAGLASRGNFADKLANIAALQPQGRAADATAQQKLDATNQTAAFFHNNGRDDLAQLVTAGQAPQAFAIWQADQAKSSKSNAPIEVNGQLVDPTSFQVLGDYRTPGGNQSARAGVGQPVTMRNKKTGETRAVQPMTVGPGQDLLTGGPLPGEIGDWEYIDPIAMAGGKASVVGDEKNAVIARAALPGAQQTLAITDKAVQTILDDPQAMQEHFGKFAGVVPQQMIGVTVPGTPKARFDVNQAQLGGQAFMQARQMLRGGGQITDYEGRRAEDAYSRMTAAAQAGDEQQYRLALSDFQEAVHAGYQKLVAAANGGYMQGQPAVTGGTGAADPLGIR